MAIDQESWDARLAKAVGQNVRRLRVDRPTPISAQALSNITDSLGNRVHRSVIAKLENGERAHVTLGDMFVLARALNVPPFALIAPLTTADLVEVLPGSFMTSWDAVGWFNGDSNTISDAVTARDAEGNFAEWYSSTDAYQQRWRYDVETLRYHELRVALESEPDQNEREHLRERVLLQRNLLKNYRELLLRNGVVGVPEEL